MLHTSLQKPCSQFLICHSSLETFIIFYQISIIWIKYHLTIVFILWFVAEFAWTSQWISQDFPWYFDSSQQLIASFGRVPA